MENCKFKDDLYLEVKKQYSRQNLNNILVNNIKPKLLSILEEAKDSFGTLSSQFKNQLLRYANKIL